MKKKWGIVCNWVYLYGHKTIGPSWKKVNKLKLDHQPWVCVKLGNGFEWKLCRAPTRWPTNHINGHYWPTARKQSQGSFSIQVTTFWSKICFWCQDSPHSDVYFATNPSSQKKNCCVRCEINYIYHTLQITQLKKTTFYVLKILKYMYKSRYSDPSMGLSFSFFHCHRWKDQLNTFASSDLPPN